jgi:hypothetical protein
MPPLIWIWVVLYAIAMIGVSFAARHIVGHFGWLGGLVALVAVYAAAIYYERRQNWRQIEVLPPALGCSPWTKPSRRA